MKEQQANLLIVGNRKKAVAAAKRLGFRVTVCDTLESFYQKPKLNYTAVIAAKENTVPVAAELRSQLNLPGTTQNISWLCHDKWQMKNHAQHHNIAITPCLLIDEETTAKHLIATLGLPLVIKQRCTSGGRGLHIIQDEDELNKHLQPNMMAEKYIYGMEFSIESYIQDKEILFTNITEYYQLKFTNILPTHLPSVLHQKVLDLNKTIIRLFNIENGMTHLEIYVTAQGEILFGEIALRPPGGYIMDLLEYSYGFDAWEAFIKVETGIPASIPAEPIFYSAAWLIHPGQGEVTSVVNLRKIKQHAEVVSATLRMKRGDQIKNRAGLEDYGRIIFRSRERFQILQAITEIQDHLKVTVRT